MITSEQTMLHHLLPFIHHLKVKEVGDEKMQKNKEKISLSLSLSLFFLYFTTTFSRNTRTRMRAYIREGGVKEKKEGGNAMTTRTVCPPRPA